MAQTPALMYATGNMIDHTPVADVAAGAVVLIGTVPMIAPVAIPAGMKGTLAAGGVWKVPQAAEVRAAGDAIYWDADGASVDGNAGAAVATYSLGNLMGVCVEVTAATDVYAKVLLTAAMRTATLGESVTANDIAGGDSTLTIGGLGAAQGGLVSVTGGTSATAGNAGGAVSLVGGVPGATGVGGAAGVTGGIGGSTSGTGGAVALAGGVGTAGNANGGAASVLGGNAHGSGTDGVVNVGTSNTSALTIGATSISTTAPGPQNLGIGASTAAAGTVVGDATALPAGTAPVYPTTAANDAAGVIINAADKVTGRMILIGNGVKDKTLLVYPPTGGNINGLGANVAVTSVSGKGIIIVCLDSGGNTWLAW